MADWQFLVLVALLLWIVWRTRSVAQTSPWFRDALLRRVFEQLNRIEARQQDVPFARIEQERNEWWENEIAQERGRPWTARRHRGPWR
jgi:hypothetical protein